MNESDFSVSPHCEPLAIDSAFLNTLLEILRDQTSIRHKPAQEDCVMPKLSQVQIGEELKTLPGWEYQDNSLRKLFRFNEFMDGIRFIGRIAELAEAADHHPDIHINYTRVTFVCSTHSDGGVTDKDTKLAHQIEQAFAGQTT